MKSREGFKPAAHDTLVIKGIVNPESLPRTRIPKKRRAGALQECAGPSVTGHRLVLTLERKSPAQLEEPRLVRTGRRTEAPIGNVRIDVCVVCPVEKVEEFEAELEAYAF